MLLDRAWGRSNISISHGGDEDKPALRVIRSYYKGDGKTNDVGQVETKHKEQAVECV